MAGVESLIEQLASATVDEVENDKELSFAGRGLKLDTEDDAAEIVKAIKSCPGMTTLRLDGNTLGIPAAQAIAKALENQSNFKKALWKDMFTRRTVDEIPKALSHLSDAIILSNARLVQLDLSDNAFGPRGLIGIVKLLESPSCYTLKELHLNNNGLGISGAKMLAESLCKCVENSRRDGNPLDLKVFVCGRNRLENDGATAVARFFKMLGTLESVALPQNGIYHPGIKSLADAFVSNPNLKVINIEDNSLTEEGAKHIAKCLSSLKYIHMLNFGDCLLRTQGAVILAEALKSCCPELRELYLGFNEINKEGGRAVVEAVKSKEMLTMVVLNGNTFGKEGCEEIKSVVGEFGMGDKFGTLSEDEGDENDDDEDDDDEKESFENGEERSDSANEEDLNESVEVKDSNKYTSPMQKASPFDFVNEPTLNGLIALQSDKEALLSVLKDDAEVGDCIDLFLTVCSVVKAEDASSRAVACDFVDLILTKAVKLSEHDLSIFNNCFIVSLRLIKCEDKKFVTRKEMSNVFYVLQHAVKQPYFPKSSRDQLKFFLSRPLTYIKASEKSKHGLLQALFQV